MQTQDQLASSRLEHQQSAEDNIKTRTPRPRSRTKRIVRTCATLLVGIVLGAVATVLYALTLGGNVSPLITPPTQVGNIVIQIDSPFIAHLVEENLQTSRMPGRIKNVQVQLIHGSRMTIGGDDEFSVLHVRVTRHFTLELQPYVKACQLQIHVIHANLNAVPVTTFVSSFENQINQQFQIKPGSPGSSLVYCTVGVQTEPDEMLVTYRVTPV